MPNVTNQFRFRLTSFCIKTITTEQKNIVSYLPQMKETVKLQLAQTESVRKNPCMKSWWFEVKSAETLKISTNAKGKKRKTCLIASD